MLVNIKTAISKQELCQNTDPPPNFVLFSPFCSLFFPIGVLFSLKCPGFGLQSLFLGGILTPPVDKPNIYSQEFSTDSYTFHPYFWEYKFCFLGGSAEEGFGRV
jgi:hypothetical protein